MDAAVYVSEHLDRFRHADRDGAFFGLIHRELNLVPHLVAAYSSERDPAVKAFIVEVLWQQRDGAVIPTLGQALLESDNRVWREALNGLVALASAESLGALRAARSRRNSHAAGVEFSRWLEEAIEQAETILKGE
jgi:HEAT repeats